jgi:hypothetical protein
MTNTMKTQMDQATAYSVYLPLFWGNANAYARTKLMTEAFFAACGHKSWRVVGLTNAAAELIASAPVNLTGSGLQRAHLTDRKATIDAIFDRPEPIGCDELFAFWTERDVTVLAMANENKNIATSKWLELDNHEGMLFSAKDYGFRYRRGVEPIAVAALLR